MDFNATDDDFRKEVDTFKEAICAPPNFLLDCPKFRILIIGQAGVGKSTICSKVFSIPDAKNIPGNKTIVIDDRKPGTKIHQVWNPITFPGHNENIILHDTAGFEAGDKESMEEIEQFIKFRKQQPNLADQLHCIWYCISCANNRPIQTAEKRFFKEMDVGRIPVLAVFTQFDMLEAQHESRLRKKYRVEHPGAKSIPNEVEDMAHLAAVADYDKHYRRALEELIGLHARVGIERVAVPDAGGDDYLMTGESSTTDGSASASGVNDLINRTLDMLTQEGLRLLWTAAQRESADLKLQESVHVGMQLFWRVQGASLAPFVPFIGASAIYSAFNSILSHISHVWGILDPDRVLEDKSARNKFLEGCFNASVARRIGASFLLAINIMGPLSSALTAITVLKMIAGITLIYERLFWLQKSEDRLPLTRDKLDAVVCKFRNSPNRWKMATHIDGAIDLSKCYSRKACSDAVHTAIEIARSSVNREFTRHETLAN